MGLEEAADFVPDRAHAGENVPASSPLQLAGASLDGIEAGAASRREVHVATRIRNQELPGPFGGVPAIVVPDHMKRTTAGITRSICARNCRIFSAAMAPGDTNEHLPGRNVGLRLSSGDSRMRARRV